MTASADITRTGEQHSPRHAVRHPFDPLVSDEIGAAVRAVRDARPELDAAELGVSFPLVALIDPPKDEVAAHVPGRGFSRRAKVVVRDRGARRTYEAIVRLHDAAVVEAWTEVGDAYPPIAAEDFEAAAAAVLSDEGFVASLRRRGVEDLTMVQVDPLAPGTFPQNPEGRRIVWATPYLRPMAVSNPYARPIENLRAAVDVDSGEVLQVDRKSVV